MLAAKIRSVQEVDLKIIWNQSLNTQQKKILKIKNKNSRHE